MGVEQLLPFQMTTQQIAPRRCHGLAEHGLSIVRLLDPSRGDPECQHRGDEMPEVRERVRGGEEHNPTLMRNLSYQDRGTYCKQTLSTLQ